MSGPEESRSRHSILVIAFFPISTLLRNVCTGFHSGCTGLHPTSDVCSFFPPESLQAFVGISFLGSNHYARSQMESQSGFRLHFCGG